MKRALALATLVSSLLLPAAARADTQRMVGADSPSAIAEILKGYGSASLERDKDGDPRIIARAQGIKYTVIFYGCSKGESCRNVQFRASWSMKDSSSKPSLGDMNKWNVNKIFGKAYLDGDGDPVIEMPIVMADQMTVDNFEKSVSMWVDVIQSFKKEIE